MMKIKRVVFVVLISLFTSLFQGAPTANAAGAPLWKHNLGNNQYGFHPYGRDATGGCDWKVGLDENGSPITGFYITILLTTSNGTRNYRLVTNDASVGTLTTNRFILTKNFLISTGALPGTYYYYYVKPVNSLGTGFESDALAEGVSGAGGYCSYERGSSLAPVAPGTPTAVSGNERATVTISAPTSGSPPSSYTVTAYDSTGTNPIAGPKTCTVTVPDTSCEISGLTNGTPYTFKSTATNGLGTSAISTASTAVIPNNGAPSITNVTSSTPDGSYKVGDVISIQVTFSGAVTVTETPKLTLETGNPDRTIDYVSGSGTSTLTFSYTVQDGDTSSDLTYVATDSLSLNSGTIKSASSVDAVLSLPSPAATRSLGANKAIVVDTTAPTQTIGSIDISADTGSSATDFITTTALQTITGTLSAALGGSESLWASLNNGVSYIDISSFVNGTSISWTGATLIGSSSIKIEVRDAAGNVGTPSTQSYELDITAPTQTIGSIDISADSGSSATDFITATASQTITGTLSASLGGSESLWGSIDGGTNYTNISSSVSGTAISWLNVTLSGSSSIKFQVRDTAGASGPVATQAYVLDTTAPTPIVATSSVTTASGVTVRSSEAGIAYLVKTGINVSSIPASPAVDDDKFNQVTISTANTDTLLPTDGLVEGEYKLYVVDAAGNLSLVTASNTVTVAVAAAPTSNSAAAPTGNTTIGSTLTNAVTFGGVPTPTLSYQWKSCTSDSDTATACSDIAGSTGSSFVANAIDLVGKFIRVLVTAVNGILPNGSALSAATAAISAGPPGVPTLGTPTLGDLQINVPFTAPASNGGSTIIKYQFSTDGGVNWLDRTDSATVTSPIVIKFLSTNGTTPIVAGTDYPIQIRAVNTASTPTGQGTTSVSVTAGTTPGAPTAVSAIATGATPATVSFTAPTNTGGIAITRYTVTSSPGGITASGSSSPIIVTGLNASTPYTFTVTATNDAATSLPSAASNSITTSAPPAAPSAPEPAPEPVCNAACVAAQNAAAAKVVADKVAAQAKVVSDVAAKVVADKVVVDKTAAEAAAKTAVEKAAAAVVAKAAADTAAINAVVAAKAASDAQQASVVAAEKAAAALKSSTSSAASKAAATATAAKAALTAANTVKAAAAAAKAAATAKTAASNASKQVDIAIGALGSKTAAATTTAQANAIAAAAKAAANAAAKASTEQAVAAKEASNNANNEATAALASVATEQKLATDAVAEEKVANDAAIKATEEKIATAAEAQKAAEAVVKALEEKIALAEASVKAKDITERAAIDKKIEEITAKVADAQKAADVAKAKAEIAATAQESAQAVAKAATQKTTEQTAKAIAVKLESLAKAAAATKAAADANLAAKIAKAAVAAAAKVPSRAVISAKPSSTAGKNSAKATISGLKPGQKVKVTVNVKGK